MLWFISLNNYYFKDNLEEFAIEAHESISAEDLDEALVLENPEENVAFSSTTSVINTTTNNSNLS